MPGRLQQIDSSPLTLLDGAHNPDGMRALAESLPEFVGGHDRVVAVVSILDDKDAAGMLAALHGGGGVRIDALVLTASHNPRTLPPPTLQSLDAPIEGPPSEIVPRPAPGAGPGARAGRPGRRGHRHRLPVSDRRSALARPPRARVEPLTPATEHSSMNDDDQPRFLAMIGLVALIVAVVILVFFGIGYLFGRAFL